MHGRIGKLKGETFDVVYWLSAVSPHWVAAYAQAPSLLVPRVSNSRLMFALRSSLGGEPNRARGCIIPPGGLSFSSF